MFNTFASYLFGGKNTNNDKDNIIDDSSSSLEQGAILDSSDVVELTTVCANEDDDDHDWLLVERHTKEEKEDELIPYPFGNLFDLPLVPYKSPLRLPSRRKHGDDNAHFVLSTHLPALYPSSMDESWFVTPPQCFTSVPIHLPENPLENLLIEHTSMSVYCSIRRNSNHLVSKPFPMVDDLVVLELTQGELEDDLNEVSVSILFLNFNIFNLIYFICCYRAYLTVIETVVLVVIVCPTSNSNKIQPLSWSAMPRKHKNYVSIVKVWEDQL